MVNQSKIGSTITVVVELNFFNSVRLKTNVSDKYHSHIDMNYLTQNTSQPLSISSNLFHSRNCSNCFYT